MKRLSAFLTVASLVIGIGFMQFLKLHNSKQAFDDITPNEANQQVQTAALKLALSQQMPRIGFQNMWANAAFLDFIQYFGDSPARQLTGYGLSPQFFNLITADDPRFVSAYIYLTNAISLYAGQPEESVRLMERGLKSMSPKTPARSYFVWRYKGTDEMLFLGKNSAAQTSFQTAADWATQSPDKDAPLTARLSQQTANFLATDPNSKPALINGWMNVLVGAVDDTIRQKALAQIEALGGKVLFAENGQVTVRYTRDE